MLLALTWEAGVALGLSAAATIVAVISGVFTYLAYKRAGRAETRAENAEKRAERAEQREEVRFKREWKQADAERRADLMLWATGSGSTPGGQRVGYRIANNGKVTAHDVRVWLRDADGKDVSIAQQPTFKLTPDEADDTHGIPIPNGLDLNDLRFTVSWNDGKGPHTWPTQIPPY